MPHSHKPILTKRKELAGRQVSSYIKPATIEEFFEQQKNQDLLRFITCGSVDDGKSTLIGRLLWESRQLFDDQLIALQSESKKYGTQGDEIDFALLVDGLTAEREQGITIDVAYRFFSTHRRKYIVADTPGHEQYTRNMITGASTADVAVLLVDARSGISKQTKRHAFLVSLMGIRHVVLAINKMDLVDFGQVNYQRITNEFVKFTTDFDFDSITSIPVSALLGDNVIKLSDNTSWYQGPALMTYLESVSIVDGSINVPMIFPVQLVNRFNSNFRGFSGKIAQGNLSVGDEIIVPSSKQKALIADIVTMNSNLSKATANDSVTLILDREIDASRGDIICTSHSPLQDTDHFEAIIVWFDLGKGLPGRSYYLKLATQWTSVSITNIKYRIDVNTLGHEAVKQLGMNDISVCNISAIRPLTFDTYKRSKIMGSFILIDKFTNATVAAGMIQNTLRRSHNVHTQALSINRTKRESLNGHKSRVVWFTGLSGSGKSTLANCLEIALHDRGIKTYILDGDNIRQGLNKDLGFVDSDRVENIRRVAEVAKLMIDAGLIVMVAFISPFRREREMVRELIGKDSFIEVYVDTPIEVCEERDVKGLYKQARAGNIPNMTGVNSPYEIPSKPDMIVDGNMPFDMPIKKLVGLLF